MSGGVTYDEARDFFHWLLNTPGQIRALRGFDSTTWGPLPFFVYYPDAEAEVEITLNFEAGKVEGCTSMRIGRRYSYIFRDWASDPWTVLSDPDQADLEASFRAAAEGLK
jgi:hypothetical protein